jgi:hypothetical protein
MDREAIINKVKEQCKVLVGLLEENLNSGKLFVVNYKQMQIGKTTALIEVSKRYRIPVIMGIGSVVPIHKEAHNYNLIYCADEVILAKELPLEMIANGVLIDEKVSAEKVYEISKRVQIRTGFFYSDILLPTISNIQTIEGDSMVDSIESMNQIKENDRKLDNCTKHEFIPIWPHARGKTEAITIPRRWECMHCGGEVGLNSKHWCKAVLRINIHR